MQTLILRHYVRLMEEWRWDYCSRSCWRSIRCLIQDEHSPRTLDSSTKSLSSSMGIPRAVAAKAAANHHTGGCTHCVRSHRLGQRLCRRRKIKPGTGVGNGPPYGCRKNEKDRACCLRFSGSPALGIERGRTVSPAVFFLDLPVAIILHYCTLEIRCSDAVSWPCTSSPLFWFREQETAHRQRSWLRGLLWPPISLPPLTSSQKHRLHPG